MSYLSFPSGDPPKSSAAKGSMRRALAAYLIQKHGAKYQKTISEQRIAARKTGMRISRFAAAEGREARPLVGIAGGGFAGMYAGLILQSLGIEFEIFESSDRVGGRIKTWYSTDYDPNDVNKACLYGEVGGMRLPQFSPDMLPVQQLALAVNAVLGRNGLKNEMVYWRKFYYNSPVQRMRFNNMTAPILSKNAQLNPLNFDEASGGNLPAAWTTVHKDDKGNPYLPVNMVMEMVNKPFMDAIGEGFEKFFALLEQYDNYSMWDYLVNVFTLGDMGEYYNHDLGKKKDHLPWPVASYLETTSVGSGMFAVSFVEMVLASYDWSGSLDPYRPGDPNVYMLTGYQGMQHLPDACRTVINLRDHVTVEDGQTAQVQLGILPNAEGKHSYNPPNLTPDAQPLPPTGQAAPTPPNYDHYQAAPLADDKKKERLHLRHRVKEIKYDPQLNQGSGGMKIKITPLDKDGKPGPVVEKEYAYVISTLPFGAYLNGDRDCNLLNDLSFEKATALRECNYMQSFKAFLTFKKNFWSELGERQGYPKSKGLGAASTDRPNRQIIYPSYGYDAEGGVLQVYSWAEDARRMGVLSDEERINECLKGIAYLYPDADVYGSFAGYDPERTTKTWYWDNFAGGGAFALFNPGQFSNLYPTLLTPESNGHLLIAGEACSVHHGWIVGALDSAYNAVYQILNHLGDAEKITEMQKTWGMLSAPDIEQ